MLENMIIDKDVFQSIAETVGVGMVLLSKDLTILWANSVVCEEFIGEDVVGKTCYQMYAGRETVCDGCGILKIFSGEVPHGAKERKGLDCSGKEIWSEVIARPCTFDDDGQVATVIQTVVPITERKLAELRLSELQDNLEKEILSRTSELRESESSLLSVFEAADDIAMVKTDIRGRDSTVLMFSPGAQKIFGYKAEEMIGQPVAILHLKDDVEKFDDIHKTMRETNEGVRIETILVRKSGEEFSAIFSAYPIFGGSGQLVATIGVSMDISKQKKSQEELSRMQMLSSIGTLAGGIAHDFNNLLAGIIGHIDLAEELSDAGSEVYLLLNEAKNASIRAAALTKQLLTFAKGGDPVKVTADIGKVIVDSANSALSGNSVICNYDILPDLWQAKIDIAQMSQVIESIIINACEAMPNGGTVTITCQNCIECPCCGDNDPSKGQCIEISVSDSGDGIQPEVLEKVFDPYFSTKDRYDKKGSGLGLSICHSIVKKHGGDILISSQVGSGTTVRIYLPAFPSVFEESFVLDEKPSADNGFRGAGDIGNQGDSSKAFGDDRALVMVMDDERTVRNMTGKMLRRFGYDTIFAENGDEAIKLYKEHFDSGNPIDVSIIDLTIPGGKGGKEAIREILQIDPEAVAVVASGYSNDPIMANFKSYGFAASLPKPFELSVLKKLINGILHKAMLN